MLGHTVEFPFPSKETEKWLNVRTSIYICIYMCVHRYLVFAYISKRILVYENMPLWS
jgi:hypothetical protein